MSYCPESYLRVIEKEEFNRTCLVEDNASITNFSIGRSCLSDKTNSDLYKLCLAFARWFIDMFPCLHAINIWDSNLPANQHNLDNVAMLLKQMSKKYDANYCELIKIATCNIWFCIDYRSDNVNFTDYCSGLELFKQDVLECKNGFRKYIDSFFSNADDA